RRDRAGGRGDCPRRVAAGQRELRPARARRGGGPPPPAPHRPAGAAGPPPEPAGRPRRVTSTRHEAPAPAPDPARALGASFYERPVVDVARDLLGCLLVSQHDGITTAGLIVETEAYAGPDDPASHAAFRRNGTVTAMWGPPGRAYVYLAYGVYPCFNVVTGPEGEAAAVLIRAIAPVAGIEHMAVRRGGADGPRLASGPGRLAVALGITLA